MTRTLSFPRLPLRVARAVAARVQDAVAERTAPPVVTAVRRAGLTRLGPRALADLHDRVADADALDLPGVVAVEADAGAAVVAADARSSAREVVVYGVRDRARLADALRAQGCPPETSRVTLDAAPPTTDGAEVAVAYAATAAALKPLGGRLVARGMLLAGPKAEGAVPEACPRPAFRVAQRTPLLVVERA